MKGLYYKIRDRIKRAYDDPRGEAARLIWSPERVVLEVLAESERQWNWADSFMTYVEVSFHSGGRVSPDTALAALQDMQQEQAPRVEYAIRRHGEVGSYWAISAKGREWLRGREGRWASSGSRGATTTA